MDLNKINEVVKIFRNQTPQPVIEVLRNNEPLSSKEVTYLMNKQGYTHDRQYTFVNSIFHRLRKVGLIYSEGIDTVHNRYRFNAEEYNRFKSLLEQF